MGNGQPDPFWSSSVQLVWREGHAQIVESPRVRTFKKDLAAAGIAFEDAYGRRADFHALRDTFGTHLAASGATPCVLKELMRHGTVQQS